jgi:hypothetical protein
VYADYGSVYARVGPQLKVLTLRVAPAFADPVWLLACARAVTVRRDAQASAFEREAAIAFACLVASVSIGWRFSRYYFLMAMAPAVMLAAVALVRLVRVRHLGGARTALSALAFLGAAEALYLAGTSLHTGYGNEWSAFGRGVAARTERDDRILVWGWRPELYVIADRVSASGFVHAAFIARDFGFGLERRPPPVDEKLLARLVADLERCPPKLIVDAARISCGNPHLYDLRRYPELVAFIGRRYGEGPPIEGPVPLPTFNLLHR